jgi:hypothetical protein
MLAGLAGLADHHMNCLFVGRRTTFNSTVSPGADWSAPKQSLTWTAVTGRGKKRIAPPAW